MGIRVLQMIGGRSTALQCTARRIGQEQSSLQTAVSPHDGYTCRLGANAGDVSLTTAARLNQRDLPLLWLTCCTHLPACEARPATAAGTKMK